LIPHAEPTTGPLADQRALHQIEIVRVCALWDRVEIDKENIPIIVEAVDHPDVIGMLVEETRSHWQHKGGVIFTAQSDDPQLIAAATEVDEQFGQQQATAAQDDLRAAIKKSARYSQVRRSCRNHELSGQASRSDRS
jgi:hypothetical protein